MKLQLPSGKEVKIGVYYGEQEVPLHQETIKLRTSRVRITLMKSGEGTDAERCKGQLSFEGQVACSTQDRFVRKEGKRLALVKVFHKDAESATEQAVRVATASGSTEKEHDGVSLKQDAKSFYVFSRSDRTAIFKAVCPEYSRNDPARKAYRERMLFERLLKKFGVKFPKEIRPKVLKVERRSEKVDGVMVGAIL